MISRRKLLLLKTLQRVMAAITVLAILVLVVLIASGAESNLLSRRIQPYISSQRHH
jgi:hypothetical protein